MDKFVVSLEKSKIIDLELEGHLRLVLEQIDLKNVKKVLLIPPDFTRCFSKAGEITVMLYKMLGNEREVKVMPALGTHMPMSDDEILKMFGESIPKDRFLIHDWRNDTVKLGFVPKAFVSELSEGMYEEEIDVEVNHHITNGEFDLIFSIGQVVPHEVVGMANYSKNIFVGCGGRQMINKSHMLSATCGLNITLGVRDTPTRRVFDYAQEHFMNDVPLVYIQTVTTVVDDVINLDGVFTGNKRTVFEQAAKRSQELNIVYLKKPVQKVIAYLDPEELKTTWVGNKGIYRTSMLVADGGDLIILAPGVKQFGESFEVDELIRKYGYKGRDYVLSLYNTVPEVKEKSMVAAHLIQGSSDGRYNITYATRLISKEEIENVGYQYMPYDDAAKLYDPLKLKEGYNIMENGEEVYFVKNPATGLWRI